jgi:arylformamidase
MLYRDYDQAGLDAQYNLRLRHPDAEEHFEVWTARGGATRRRLEARLDLAYGPSAAETLDVFLPANAAGAQQPPIHVFIHGGYWQSRDKSDFSFVADGLVAAGAIVVVVNYALAPTVGMDEIVRQNRAAVAWTWRHAGDFGGDAERLYLSGHSAGGHLTAMLLATDWPDFDGLPGDTIKGGLAISGLYDLEAIRLCYLNEVLGLDAATAARLSPLGMAPGSAGCVVAVGGGETDEFLRQSSGFAERWRQAGATLEELVPPGHNHFTIMNLLADSDGVLCLAACRQMGLTE